MKINTKKRRARRYSCSFFVFFVSSWLIFGGENMGTGNANRTTLFNPVTNLRAIGLALICLSIAVVAGCRRGATPVAVEDFDLVILNGRVIDPESKLDSARNVGVNAGKIITVTSKALTGRTTIDAKGQVVAPG